MRCVRVHAETSDAAARATQLVSRLPALTELEIYDIGDWVVHALRAAPLLQKVMVDLGPAWRSRDSHKGLRDIMIACSAALTIQLGAMSDLDHVFAALEDAKSLTDLTLDLKNGDCDISANLKPMESLQRNSSRVRFALELNLGPARAKQSLQRAKQTAASLQAFLQSLRRNESLQIYSLRLRNKYLANVHLDSRISGEIVTFLLDGYTTLQQIEGLWNASLEDSRQIRRLLLLNRYGADLVANNVTNVPMEDLV